MNILKAPINDSLMTLTKEEAAALDWATPSDAPIDDECLCSWDNALDEDLDPSDEDHYDDE